MNWMKLVVSFLMFTGIVILGVDSVQRSRRLQITKSQYSEINHFSHGLFSVNVWKKEIGQIVSDELDGLSFKGKTGETLRPHLERQLGVLIDKIATRMKKENYKTTEGWLKQSLIDSFVNVKAIKAGIPEYADAMIKELSSPKTEAELKRMLASKVDQYMETTFDKNDAALKSALVEKYGQGEEEKAKLVLEKKLDRGHAKGSTEAWIMIGLAVGIFAILGIGKKPLRQWEYFLLSLTLLTLLLVGIMTPMIDMEAKISELSFVLFDHEVVFKDQVLFFQSKSIIDVFHIMITHKDIEMKFVGILLVTFSVIFPMFKLLATLAYYYDYCAARSKKFVTFFVFQSGKWSMADVLVIAIFMAYIGFNGIINSQLNNIREAGESIDILTTNGTQLQPGYFVFVAFTILALFLSSFLKTRPYDCSGRVSKT